MDAINMLKSRRSVRKFTDEKVDRELIKEIVDVARYSPTWANSQTTRYTVVDDAATLDKIANDGIGGFEFNKKTTGRASGAVVVSAVKGLSGFSPDGEVSTKKGQRRMGDVRRWRIMSDILLSSSRKGYRYCYHGHL